MQDEFYTYHARVQQVTFNYPKTWVPSMQIETGPLGQQEFGFIEIPGTARPSMAYFAAGKPAVIDKEAIEPERDITIVTSTPVTIPNWPGEVRYVEAVIAATPDGQDCWVMYGLSSPNDMVNEPKTFRSKQDILPLLLKDASTPNPGEGLLAFFGSLFGFVNKTLAADFFKDPTYQQVKAMMLSTAFTRPPAPAPTITLPNGQILGQVPAAYQPASAPAPYAAPQAPAAAVEIGVDIQAAPPGTATAPSNPPVSVPAPHPDDDPTTLRIPR